MLYHILSAEDTPLTKLDSIGTSKDPDFTRFGPGQRSLYQIHYVVSGKGTFNGNPIKAGQGFLITPQSFEHYYPDKSDPWEYVWATSQDEGFGRLFNLYNADPDTQIFEYNSVAFIKNTIPLIQKKNNQYLAPSELLEIFLRMFNSHIKPALTTNEEGYFSHAEHYILTNFHHSLTVNTLTHMLGISQPYLYKIFQKNCNMSPKEYIDFTRFTEAKKLLSDTNLTISQIATSVGYNDVLSFSKFFKNKSGLSPTMYRNT